MSCHSQQSRCTRSVIRRGLGGFSPSPTLYNGDLLVGYQRVRARIHLTDDGRGFLGRFTNDILDPDDNVVASITGTVTGKRILIN